jgi:hypothetical protein
MKAARKLNFIFIMRFWLLLMLCGLVFKAAAQENQVEGIVFDKFTLDRVDRVNIQNITTGKSFYNNLKGEFKIDARPGDKIVLTRDNYAPDTIDLKSNANLVVYLQRLAIPLREVTIRDSLATPLKRLEATRREFSKAYGSNAYSDPFSTAPGGGAGISIDAIWNSLSKAGRNAQHLQGIIQHDYEQNVIDFRFNRTFVGNITKLKDQELSDFMIRYRPGYYMVTNASDYEFIVYIRNNARRYRRNKKTVALPPLIPAKS